MLCERCNQRQATVHLTQVINNKKVEMNICEYCANELQQEAWGFSPQFNLHKFLGSLIENDFSQAVKIDTHDNCSKCGISKNSFAKGGLLGCPSCYQSFHSQIIPLVRRVHGTIQHTGKVPKRTGGKVRIRKEIMDLKRKLQQAVNKEEFEKAAMLRDQIKQLEEKLNKED